MVRKSIILLPVPARLDALAIRREYRKMAEEGRGMAHDVYDPQEYQSRKVKGICVYCGKQPACTTETGRRVSSCQKCLRDSRRRRALRMARQGRRRKPQTDKPPIIVGTRTRNGAKMTKGSGWKLVATKGKPRWFSGRLIATHNVGAARIAVFSVRK